MGAITLLQNGLLATFTNADGPTATPVARRADVLIDADRIVQVAAANSIDAAALSQPDAQVIDCSNKWIAPGFVDTHRHLWMSVVEGHEDWTLAEYLAKLSWTTASVVDADDVYIGELAGALQALHGGTTTVVDHFHCANSIEHIKNAIEAAIESGLRCMLCMARQSVPSSTDPLRFDNDSAISDMQVSMLKSLAQIDAGKLTCDGRVTLGLAYDVLGLNPAEDKRIVTLARSLNVTPITAHFVGGPQVPAYGNKANLWNNAGLLDGDVIFSHANGFTHQGGDENEWTLLKNSGASIASTPEDELGMGHGDPVTYEAVRRGVKVGLGIDCKSIVSADMFPAMHSVLQWERGRIHALHAHASLPKAVKYNAYSCASVFRLATLGGAEAAHAADRIGSIEPGKLADIVLYNADSINLAGCTDPFKGIVIHATAQDVDLVMVNGTIVKKDGKLLPVPTSRGEEEWPKIAAQLKTRIAGIRTRLAGLDLDVRYNTVAKNLHYDFADKQ